MELSPYMNKKIKGWAAAEKVKSEKRFTHPFQRGGRLPHLGRGVPLCKASGDAIQLQNHDRHYHSHNFLLRHKPSSWAFLTTTEARILWRKRRRKRPNRTKSGTSHGDRDAGAKSNRPLEVLFPESGVVRGARGGSPAIAVPSPCPKSMIPSRRDCSGSEAADFRFVTARMFH